MRGGTPLGVCDRAILAFMPNRLVRVPTSHAKQGKAREPQVPSHAQTHSLMVFWGWDRATNSASMPSNMPACGASSGPRGSKVGMRRRKEGPWRGGPRHSSKNWSRVNTGTGLGWAGPSPNGACCMAARASTCRAGQVATSAARSVTQSAKGPGWAAPGP